MLKLTLVASLVYSVNSFSNTKFLGECEAEQDSKLILIQYHKGNGQESIRISSSGNDEVNVLMSASFGKLILSDNENSFRAKHSKKFGFRQDAGYLRIDKLTGRGKVFFKDYGTLSGEMTLTSLNLVNCSFY